MAFEQHRRPLRTSAVRRAWLYCLFLSLPTLLFAGILAWQQRVSGALALLAGFCLLLYLALIAGALI